MLQLRRFGSLFNNQLVPLILKAYSELEYNKFVSDDLSGIHSSYKAIAAFDEDTAIGIITYDLFKSSNYAYIFLGYVSPAYRQEGVYNALFNDLKKIVAEADISKICSSTHVNNNAMKAVFQKQGRKPVAIAYEYIMDKTVPSESILPKNKKADTEDDDVPF